MLCLFQQRFNELLRSLSCFRYERRRRSCFCCKRRWSWVQQTSGKEGEKAEAGIQDSTWVPHTHKHTLHKSHSLVKSKSSKVLDTGNVIIFILCVWWGSQVPYSMYARVINAICRVKLTWNIICMFNQYKNTCKYCIIKVAFFYPDIFIPISFHVTWKKPGRWDKKLFFS